MRYIVLRMEPVKIIERQALKDFLQETGLTATALARRAGVTIQAITRVIEGPRERCGYEVSKALQPFIYGDLRPGPTAPEQAESQEAA